MAPIHSYGQVENATASSAGGSPDGEATEVTENTEEGIGRTRIESAFCNGLGQQVTAPP
jgi:hypothetical protein